MRWPRAEFAWILTIAAFVVSVGVPHGALSGAATKHELRFVVIGDNRPAFRTERQPFVYRLLLKEIMARKPLGVFNTGDIIVGGTEDSLMLRRMFAEFKKVSSLLTVPLHVAPGNHDYFNPTSRALFEEMIGPPYFSVDYGGCHFVVLSSECEGEVSRIAGKQFQWLEQDLTQHRGAQCLFVVVHRPLYPVGPHAGDSFDRYPAHRDSLAALLKAYGVKILFAGHEHLYHDATYGGLRQIITGGGGAPLYAPADSGGYFHFVLVRVRGKKVQTEVVRVQDPYQEAARALERNDASHVLRLMEQILAECPEETEAHLYAAVAHLRLGDTMRAGQGLASFLEHERRSVAAYDRAGRMLTAYGFWRQGLSLYREFANDKPESPESYLGLGQCFFHLSLSDSAALCVEKAVALDSLAPKIRFLAGELYEGAGMVAEAIRHYQAAARLSPRGSYGKRAAERLQGLRAR